MIFPVVGHPKDDEDEGEAGEGDWDDDDGELGLGGGLVNVNPSLIEDFGHVIAEDED